MVDSLTLDLSGCEISRNHSLTLQPPSYQPATGLIHGGYDLHGHEISKAFYNGEKFNLTLKPVVGSQRVMRLATYVQTSLPRYLAANNFEAVSQSQAGEVLGKLEDDLAAVGIKANTEAADLVRLDLFRNVHTEHSFDTYSPVLSMLEGKRMRSPQEFGGTCFLYKNSQHEIVAYDKIAEMEHKLSAERRRAGSRSHEARMLAARAAVHEAAGAGNVLRFEYRMRHGEKIRTTTGIATAGEMLRRYDDLAGIYSRAMSDNLFRFDGRNRAILQARKLEQLLSALKDLYPRSYVRRFETIAAAEGLRMYGTVESIASVIEKVSGQKGTASKFRRRMFEQKMFLKELRRREIDVEAVPIGELYSELRGKVLAA